MKIITVSIHDAKAGGATCQVLSDEAYKACSASINTIKHKMNAPKLYFLPK